MKKTTTTLLIMFSFGMVAFAKNYYQKIVEDCKHQDKHCQDYSSCQDIIYKNFKKQQALDLYAEALRLSFEQGEDKHRLAVHYEECASKLANGCSNWLVNNHTFQ